MPTFEWSAANAESRFKKALDRQDQNDPLLKSVIIRDLRDLGQRDLEQLQNRKDGLLAGALVTIKDLFDIKGSVTTAGSVLLKDQAPALEDADAVQKWRSAGAIVIGSTNMTEFAYSGLGVNPHYGTPVNPIFDSCVPGGSTSGGATSVSTGLADIALGTDTGGSLRIPAACQGLTGFKPTQNTVSRDGCLALSKSFDTPGPIARTVQECTLAWRTLSGVTENTSWQQDDLIIPDNFGLHECDQRVLKGFQALTGYLQKSGFNIRHQVLEALNQYQKFEAWQIPACEARTTYRLILEGERGRLMDPRVKSRMDKAALLSASDYQKTLDARNAFARQFKNELGGAMLLLPTCATLPPLLEELADDADYFRLNTLILRNTSMGNTADSCSIALPYSFEGTTLSLMLTAPGGEDLRLLDLAASLEPQLKNFSRH